MESNESQVLVVNPLQRRIDMHVCANNTFALRDLLQASDAAELALVPLAGLAGEDVLVLVHAPPDEDEMKLQLDPLSQVMGGCLVLQGDKFWIKDYGDGCFSAAAIVGKVDRHGFFGSAATSPLDAALLVSWDFDRLGAIMGEVLSGGAKVPHGRA